VITPGAAHVSLVFAQQNNAMLQYIPSSMGVQGARVLLTSPNPGSSRCAQMRKTWYAPASAGSRSPAPTTPRGKHVGGTHAVLYTRGSALGVTSPSQEIQVWAVQYVRQHGLEKSGGHPARQNAPESPHRNWCPRLIHSHRAPCARMANRTCDQQKAEGRWSRKRLAWSVR
jgi:hypothetical protein